MTAPPPLLAEDMLEKSKVLPLEVRRSMDLLFVLDKLWMSNRAQLDAAQKQYLVDLRARLEGLPRDGSVDLRKATEDLNAEARLAAMHADVMQVSEEKCNVSKQVYDTVASALEKLTADLKRFEAELKSSGDWKEEVRLLSFPLSLCSCALCVCFHGGPPPTDSPLPFLPVQVFTHTLTHTLRTHARAYFRNNPRSILECPQLCGGGKRGGGV